MLLVANGGGVHGGVNAVSMTVSFSAGAYVCMTGDEEERSGVAAVTVGVEGTCGITTFVGVRIASFMEEVNVTLLDEGDCSGDRTTVLGRSADSARVLAGMRTVAAGVDGADVCEGGLAGEADVRRE